ncbi:IQ domain-containing protein E [Pteropus alecto]|uniref:IQ domain-containing protein E n=1 Tax=Pteropus alecto TaxID=9402 RepID=L5KFB7_PTEAL|nr:IQ domain-containing protein E [Pteropus alecto]
MPLSSLLSALGDHSESEFWLSAPAACVGCSHLARVPAGSRAASCLTASGDDSLSAITFDSDTETKAKKESFHKPPPTSPKSPYYSKPRKVASWRALRTASMPLGHRMSLTPQKLWLGSAKQGRVLGTPVYREKEDMYDEIIELKKSLRMQKSEVDLMRTKLRRLEEEKSRKDRQIEQLLDPSRGPGSARTPAEDRPETGWVVSGLKQRILKLEQQCKDKDNTIHKLQTDIKTTNLEEMKIAMETYYEEIHRLQTLLASSETTGRKLSEKKASFKRQKKTSSVLLSLSRSVQELTEENRSLKEDLDRVLSHSPTVSRIKGYMEWSKPRLLRRIAELEKEIGPTESPKPQSSDEARSDILAHAASSSAGHGQPPAGHLEESERVRAAVRSLKGERRALRAQLQDRDLEVKQLLQAKVDLQRELESVKEGEKERREREGALRKEIEMLTKKFQELEDMKREEEGGPMEVTPEAQEEPRPSGTACGPPQQGREPEASPPCPCPEVRRHVAARTLQAHWKVYREQKKKAVEDEAAAVLQAAFRGHLARAELVSRQAWDLESSGMPSLPCQDSPPPCVPSPIVQAEDDPGQEEAITVIQSVLRAHLARIGHRATSKRASTAASAKRRPLCSGPAFPAASPLSEPPLRAEDVSSDDSDEIVIAPSLPEKKPAPHPRSLSARLTW